MPIKLPDQSPPPSARDGATRPTSTDEAAAEFGKRAEFIKLALQFPMGVATHA